MRAPPPPSLHLAAHVLVLKARLFLYRHQAMVGFLAGLLAAWWIWGNWDWRGLLAMLLGWATVCLVGTALRRRS